MGGSSYDGDDVVVKGIPTKTDSSKLSEGITYTEDGDRRCLDVEICNADQIGSGMVKCSSNDATMGTLDQKLVGDDVIEITELNDGGDEDCKIGYKQYAAAVYVDFSPWKAPAGTSAKIPFENIEFESQASMVDQTIGDSGTATGTHSSTTLQDTSKSWTVNQFAGHSIKLTGGTASGEWKQITSNTADTLTITGTWDTTPDNTTTYELTEFATRITVPVDGYYAIHIQGSIAYAAGVLGVFVYVNGTFKGLKYEHQSQTVELNSEHTRIVELSADDYIEMAVYNGGAAGLSLFGGSARTFMQIAKVG